MATLLSKNNRIRIKEKNKIKNLIKHWLRCYKPDTIQYKRDFVPAETQNNIIIGSDWSERLQGENWHDNVQDEAAAVQQQLDEILSNADYQKDLKMIGDNVATVKEKKAIRNSIAYFSKLDPATMSAEESEILSPLIDKCIQISNQDKTEKDYTIDRLSLSSIKDFYDNPEVKIKSLKAKQNNVKKLFDGCHNMNINEQKHQSKPNSVLFEEHLFKVPKHNGVGLESDVMIEIMKTWHEKYFADYDIVSGYLHKDERTSKNNIVDDHLHLIRSGYNNRTKAFDLPEHTFRLGLEAAKNKGITKDRSGVEIDLDKALATRYNKTSENIRTFSGEILQKMFYVHANRILKKHNIDFIFERKVIDEDEKLLRRKIAEQADLPKSERSYNMLTYLEKENLGGVKKVKKLQKNIKSLKAKNKKLKDENEELSEELEIANNTISNAKNAENDIQSQFEKLAEDKQKFQDEMNSFYDFSNTEDEKIATEKQKINDLHELNNERDQWLICLFDGSKEKLAEITMKIVNLFIKTFGLDSKDGDEWLENTKQIEERLKPENDDLSLTEQVRRRKNGFDNR